MQDLEQTIRERAYHLWTADGHRDGNAEAHWLTAQREVLAASLESFARVKTAIPATAAKTPEHKSAANAKTAIVGKKKRRAA